MSTALQNRLVGTIIVVALAVIFLPDLLDGKKTSKQTTFVSVPKAPDRKPLVQPKPFPSEEVAAAASRPIEVIDAIPLDEPLVDIEPVEPVASVPAEPETVITSDEKDNAADETYSDMDLIAQTDVSRDAALSSKDAGWVIQLGSFRHQKNVRELLDKLENAGYRAYSRPVDTSVGKLNKVFVGPDLRKEKLQQALPHLKELTGLSGKITEFKV